jgi:hypothetical protein
MCPCFCYSFLTYCDVKRDIRCLKGQGFNKRAQRLAVTWSTTGGLTCDLVQNPSHVSCVRKMQGTNVCSSLLILKPLRLLYDIITIMAVSGITISSLAGATLGIASHLCYFIRGERDTQSPRILATAIITPFLLFGSLQKFDSKISILYAVKITAVTSLSYLAALTLSIIIYRLFFHPLRKFPGPFTYKVTKWAHMANIASDSRNHIHTEQLRSKYGNIVRWAILIKSFKSH